MPETISQKSVLADITAQVAERKIAAHYATQNLLLYLRDAVRLDKDVADWLYRRRKPAGRDIAQALGPDAPVISKIFGHNPGNNQFLYLSIVWKASDEKEEGPVPERCCLAVERFWYQGEYNHGTHWNQIVTWPPIGPKAFSTSPTDSHWLALIAEQITSTEIALQVLREYRETTTLKN